MAVSCQSIDSLFNRGSQQPPKVSIGIAPENASKTGTPESEPFFIINKSAHVSLGKIVEKDTGIGTKRTFPDKKTLEKGKLSPWVSTRSTRQETPDPKKVGLQEKRKNEMTEDPALKNIGAHETEKFTEVRSETLKMKLWEALGDASQNKHILTQDPIKEKTENRQTEGPIFENYESRQMHDLRRQVRDTDTIETDSGKREEAVQRESPKRTRRRTFTRSTEKKLEPMITRSKGRLSKNNSKSQLPPPEQKSETKNIFTFDDCEKQIPAQKKLPTKVSRIEPRKISFLSRSTSTKSLCRSKSLQSTDKKQPPIPQEERTNPSPVVPQNSFSEKFVHNSENTPNSKGSEDSPTFDSAVSPTFALSSTPPFKKEESSPLLSENKSASDSKSPLTPEASSSGSEHTVSIFHTSNNHIESYSCTS